MSVKIKFAKMPEESSPIARTEEESEEESDEAEPEISEEEAEEYKPEEEDEESSEEGQNEEEEEDEDVILGDEDEVNQEEDDQEEDAADEAAGGTEGEIFEDARKKKPNVRRRATKKKLFPFLKKKRREYAQARDAPKYTEIDVRKTGKNLLLKMGVDEKDSVTIDKLIYNSSIRRCRAENVENLTSRSIELKKSYLEIFKYYIGARNNISEDQIFKELKSDLHGWKSLLFSEAIALENKDIDKIKNPENLADYPDHPCNKCGGIRHFRKIKQVRSGDEGQSAFFWCGTKGCSGNWRVNG